MKPGIYSDVDETEYFANPALSSTEARWLLDSPARYRYLKDHREPSTAAFDFGSAVHTRVLGTGWDVVELDFPDWRSKTAQSVRDEVRSSGRIPMLAKDLAQVDAMAESVLAHPAARKLFEADGIAEASVFATDPVTGVECKARFDFLGEIAVDLKTTAGKANADGFARSVAAYRYDVQAMHYLDTLAFAEEEVREFQYVVVEKDPPYLVGVFRLTDHFMEIGSDAAAEARRIYAECTATNTWPGYPEDVQLVAPPAWLVYQYEEQHEVEIEIA